MAKWFKFKEFCVSASHPELVEVPLEGTPIYNNILYLMERMDVIREKFGSQIIITSGYRPKNTLNKAVGGSSTSAHTVGLACDFHPKNGNIIDLAKIITEIGMDWDQLILEKCVVKNNEIVGCQWLHLGFSRTNNRRQILAWDGKTYKPVKITTDTKFKL